MFAIAEGPVRITLEKYVGPDAEELSVDPVGFDPPDVINSMVRDEGSVLSVSVGERSLLVSASGGMFTVTAILGEDDFYDRVGVPDAPGRVHFVQGGQAVEVPARHVVDSVAAEAAIVDFISGVAFEVTTGWERQGAYDD